MRRISRGFRDVRDLPLFPLFPILPIALVAGAVGLSIWSFARVRRLSRQLAMRPQPVGA
jgi:hypothetical protein